MKLLLLIMGLALACGLQELKNNAQDSLQIINGEWFTVAVASNVTSKIEEGGSFQIFLKNVTTNDGIIHGNFFKRENGECISFSMTAFPGEDGQGYVEYDGQNKFTIESINSEHAIIMVYNTKDGVVTVWGVLHGRTPDLPDGIKKKFEEICERFGIRKDQIRDLSKDDRCEKLR